MNFNAGENNRALGGIVDPFTYFIDALRDSLLRGYIAK